MPIAAMSAGAAPAPRAPRRCTRASAQDLVGVVLDPARARVIWRCSCCAVATVRPLRVEEHAAAARRPLVERGDVARRHRSSSSHARARLVRAAERGERRAAREHVVGRERPLLLARPAHLRGDLGRARRERLEQRRILARGREHSRASLPWKRARCRAPATASAGCSRSSRSTTASGIGGAGQRHRRPLERAQAEIAAQPLERVERDAPEGRELAARDREHAAPAALEHGLAARRRASRHRPAAARARRRSSRGCGRAPRRPARSRRATRARSARCPRRHLEVARVALVGLVGRADEQRSLPGVRELHAPALERRRQRGLQGSSRRTIRCAPLAKRSERGAAGSAMRRTSSTHGPSRSRRRSR